jgi:hypothetical protein
MEKLERDAHGGREQDRIMEELDRIQVQYRSRREFGM